MQVLLVDRQALVSSTLHSGGEQMEIIINAIAAISFVESELAARREELVIEIRDRLAIFHEVSPFSNLKLCVPPLCSRMYIFGA